jgi:hypothetical protein
MTLDGCITFYGTSPGDKVPDVKNERTSGMQAVHVALPVLLAIKEIERLTS